MREKNKVKIVLSLLVAFAFMLPAASVLGSNTLTEKVNAGDTQTKTTQTLVTTDASPQSMSVQLTPEEKQIAPLSDGGCWPVDVTAISMKGINITAGEILQTGTYPLDITVCKSDWDPCYGVWQHIQTDVVQEGQDNSNPGAFSFRQLTPFSIVAMTDGTNVYFNLSLVGLNQYGVHEPIGDCGIYVTTDGGVTWKYYTNTETQTQMYNGVTPIAGSSVVRHGGYYNGDKSPYSINITIPRAGIWGTCCQTTWWQPVIFASTVHNFPYDHTNYNYGGGPHQGWFNDIAILDVYPATVKKFIEVYKQRYVPGKNFSANYTNIYCENFENPCEINLNWTTLDMPVWGYNGALDTWTWSSKRYCSASHSMHSTSFDTYLPDQYDILMLGFGGSGLDVSKYDSINISWCQWIQGEALKTGNGSILTLQDYGYFEYSFTGLDGSWTQDGVDYYNSNGTTQTIKFTIPLVHPADNRIWFRWTWKSDSIFCYEGWYIDDVCIVGKINAPTNIPGYYTWDFVMDSHTWPQTFLKQCDHETFNETWTVTEEGTYKICAWLETIDSCHYSSTDYNSADCITIKIGNHKDAGLNCASISMTPPGVQWAGKYVNETATVCNLGTQDLTNIQVKQTIQGGTYFPGYTESFETVANQSDGYLLHWVTAPGPQYIDQWVSTRLSQPGRSYAHITHYDTTDGTNALCNFQLENTPKPWKYAVGTYASDYIRGPRVFKGTDANLNLFETFDLKINIGDGEYFVYGVWDWTGIAGAATLESYASKEITGPYYQNWTTMTVNISQCIKWCLAAGGGNGDDFCLGFYMGKDTAATTGDSACPWNSTWCGFIVDNIRVPAKTPTGPVVHTETQMLPYLNLSTGCTTVKFSWPNATVGQFVITTEILNADENAANNKCILTYNVINLAIPLTNPYEVDFTGTGPNHWVEEGCCGGYLWIGDPANGMYGNDWDQSLTLKNATGGLNFEGLTARVNLSFDAWYNFSDDNDYVMVEMSRDGGLTWSDYWDLYETAPTNYQDFIGPPGMYGMEALATPGWYHFWISTGTASAVMQFRFHFLSNDTWVNRGFLLDNVRLTKGAGVNGIGAVNVFGPDPCTNLNNFQAGATKYGKWWRQPDQYFYSPKWLPTTASWYGCYNPATMLYENNLDDALIFNLSIPTVFYGYLNGLVRYTNENTYDYLYGDISADGGTTWSGFLDLTGVTNLTAVGPWDMTGISGSNVKVAFEFVSDPGTVKKGSALEGITFYGMQDTTAPVTTITMTGTFDETYHYYTSPVIITLTATDDLTGVAHTYYKLDGVQHTYSGPITISADGTHTFSFWSVDNKGNVEAVKSIPDFRIDLTGPTVTLTSPTTGGLYLFGNHILDLKSGKTIYIFGEIPVAATATANGAPILVVRFYVDGTLFAEDSTAPYSASLSMKHKGPCDITAKAVDVLGHEATSAAVHIDRYFHVGL